MSRPSRTGEAGAPCRAAVVVEGLESRVHLHAGHSHLLDAAALADTYGLASGVVPWMILPPAVSQAGPGPGPGPDPDPDPGPDPDPDPGPDPDPDPDPGTTDTFTQVNWTTRAASPVSRAEALTATVGGKVYVFGGFSGALGPVTRSDVYDPAANTWTQIKDLPERTTHAGVAVSGRDVYIVGGYIGQDRKSTR